MTSLLLPSLPETPPQHYVRSQPESLDDLFTLVINDDYSAFEKIFKRTYKSLCTFSNGMVKKHELSEEIVDDVFCSLWKNRKKIHITTSFHAYLLAAVRNKSFDWLRKMKHEKRTLLENAAAVPCGQSIAHETLIYEELHEQIEMAIQELPKQCRTIFLMSRDQDLKYKEIAQILNISIKTVDTQMGRALKYLRKTIDRKQF
jgi:RNA polymerase sigma-70 factor (ECF subfamily)